MHLLVITEEGATSAGANVLTNKSHMHFQTIKAFIYVTNLHLDFFYPCFDLCLLHTTGRGCCQEHPPPCTRTNIEIVTLVSRE
jgi:hypothetical protein